MDHGIRDLSSAAVGPQGLRGGARGALTRAVVAAVTLGLALAPCARADEPERIKELEKRLAESLKVIERLETRVTDLEQKLADRPAGAAPAKRADAVSAQASAPSTAKTPEKDAQASAIAALQAEVNQISEGMSKAAADTGLPLHGFADVGAAWSTKSDPTRLRGFNAGTVDLYLVPQFGDRVRSLIEIAFEYDPNGAELSSDVERMQIGYTLRDDLTFWLGRFHTPFGLWNTWYHHGANLQTAIFRPRFIEFEDHGGIVPAHSVGVWLNGKYALGGDKLLYDLYVSNGPSIRHRTLDLNPLTDDGANKMVGVNLGYQWAGALHGLTTGVHGYASTVAAYSNAGVTLSRSRVRMGGAYFGYESSDWEAIGEYYRFRNRDDSGGPALTSSAWFAQLGRTWGSWTPYARYERAALNTADPYFTSQQLARPYRRAVLGTRYTLDSRSSFKLELSSTREDALVQIDDTGLLIPFGASSYRRMAFQYSIAF